MEVSALKNDIIKGMAWEDFSVNFGRRRTICGRT